MLCLNSIRLATNYEKLFLQSIYFDYEFCYIVLNQIIQKDNTELNWIRVKCRLCDQDVSSLSFIV